MKLLEKLEPLAVGLVKKKSLLGVEIGNTSLKIAEIKGKGKDLTLNQAHVIPLPPGKISMGSIKDSEGLASEIDTIWNTLNLKNRNISLALPGNLTILRRSKLPYVPQEEIDKAIQWEIEKVLPFKLEEIHFDYHVYDIKEGESIDLIYVVARKAVVEAYQDLFSMAGINLEVLDSAFLALANVTLTNYDDLPDVPFVVLDIGAKSSNILILRDNKILYGRNVEIGGYLVNQTISRKLGCTLEEAENIKISGALDETILREGASLLAERLYNEIIVSLNYSLLDSQERMDKIYIAGGASSTPFLATELSTLLNVDIHPLSPVRRIDIHPHLDSGYIDEISPRIPVAMGTALRGIL